MFNKRKIIKNWEDLPLLLTLGQCAMLFDVSYETVRMWAVSGKIPAVKIASEWRVEKTALRKMFERGAT